MRKLYSEQQLDRSRVKLTENKSGAPYYCASWLCQHAPLKGSIRRRPDQRTCRQHNSCEPVRGPQVRIGSVSE
jgi:hypothetical protein